MSAEIPWHAHLVLLRPRRIQEVLEHVRAAGLPTPNLWQIELGVLRMWHRVLFRSETIGTAASRPVRDTPRARLLALRPVRAPLLLRERAIAPLDLSGMLSSPERVIRHLLGAFHDGNQFVYDLRLLALYPGRLEELRERARRIVEEDTPRSRFLRDLTVFEGYHESLLEAVDRALAGELERDEAEAADPDASFLGYLSWCAAQPATPSASVAALRAGRLEAAPC